MPWMRSTADDSGDAASSICYLISMDFIIRGYSAGDIAAMRDIWNSVVREGNAFPQEQELGPEEAAAFFASQSRTAVAAADGAVAGLYILHPNNVGRCGHIANASYAVADGLRGKGIGRAIVIDSLREAAALGFRILQFNAVVASNATARKLYEALGFHSLGTIAGGFRRADGSYVDICPYWRETI